MLFADVPALFAQVVGGGFRPGNQPPPMQGQPPDPALVGGILATYFACIGFVLLIGYVIRLLHARTMVNCLKEIAPRNRTTEPGTVWLTAIPLVGIVMYIIAMFKLPDSVKNEFEDRGWREDGDFGKLMAILYLVGIFVFGPLAVVAFIMHWMKMSGYTKQFQERGGRGGDYDEDEDDRPRRRRDADEDDDEDDRPRRTKRRRDDDD